MEISFKNTKWKPIVHNEFKKKNKQTERIWFCHAISLSKNVSWKVNTDNCDH